MADGTGPGARNEMSGTAHNVLQASTLIGDVHYHGVAAEQPAAAARLAALVQRQWEDEAAAHGLYDPDPLPVPWFPYRSAGVDPERVRPPGDADPARRPPNSALAGVDADPAAIPSDNALPAVDADRDPAAAPPDTALTGADAAADLFLTLPRARLVLLGEAGAGKTTLAVLLMLRLLARRGPQDPVPVLVGLDSWDPRREHLRTWLVRQLRALYPTLGSRRGADVVAGLVDGHWIVPVLDGLDEMPGDLQVEALSAFAQSLGAAEPLILTSRIAEYEKAQELAQGGWRPDRVLQARPLDPRIVGEYLAGSAPARPERWRPLLDELRAAPDGPLARALSTPLMVWLLKRGYSAPDTEPAELADRSALPDRAAVEYRLLDSLVPGVFGRLPAPTSPVRRQWRADRAQTYLRFLARHFTVRRSRDIRWWQVGSARRTVGAFCALCVVALLALMVMSRTPGPLGLNGPAAPTQRARIAWALGALGWTLGVLAFTTASDALVRQFFFTADDRWIGKWLLAPTALLIVSPSFLLREQDSGSTWLSEVFRATS
jgi:NACHT domain